MREYLDGDDLFNAINLDLDSGVRRVLVVEGEEDYDLLFELFSGTSATLFPGYGKLPSLEAARLAEADPDATDIMFFVDADFDRLTGDAAGYPSNVIATENYDLVVDIAHANPVILHRIVRLNSNGESPSDPQQQVNLSMATCNRIGAVRYVSKINGWNLNLSGFPVHLCLPDDCHGDLDDAAFLTMAIGRTKKCTLTLPDLQKAYETERAQILDHMVLVNGHDLLDALTHVGRKFAEAKASTGYTTQFTLASGRAELLAVRAVKHLHEWADAA